MTKHESGINFRNLIRDLADMYPQDVEEVVIIELVANALDAGADRILCSTICISTQATMLQPGKSWPGIPMRWRICRPR